MTLTERQLTGTITTLFREGPNEEILYQLNLYVALNNARMSTPVGAALEALNTIEKRAGPEQTKWIDLARQVITDDYRSNHQALADRMTPLCEPATFNERVALKALEDWQPAVRDDAALLTTLDEQLSVLPQDHHRDAREVLAGYLWQRQTQAARDAATEPLRQQETGILTRARELRAELEVLKTRRDSTYWLTEDDIDRYYCRQERREGEEALVKEIEVLEDHIRQTTRPLDALHRRLRVITRQ